MPLDPAKKNSLPTKGTEDAASGSFFDRAYARSAATAATRAIRWIGYFCTVIGVLLNALSVFALISDPFHTWRRMGCALWIIGLLITGYGLIRFSRESRATD
jgi:uncharacterized protein YjeT (DUF2065 family)